MSPKSLVFSCLLLPTRSPTTPPALLGALAAAALLSPACSLAAASLLPTTRTTADLLPSHRTPPPWWPSPVALGAAVRLTVAKVKEGVEVGQIVEKLSAAMASSGEARGAGVSFGENFSRSRAKGYQFGMVAMFDSVEELGAVEEDGKVEESKDAVRTMLDEVVVLDFVVGDAPAATIL